MIEALAASFVLAFTCPTFRYDPDPPDWQGSLTIGDSIQHQPGERRILMAVLAWDGSGNFVDARICSEGEKVAFDVSEGTYYTTIKFKGGESELSRTEPVTFKDPKPGCYVFCHQ